MRASIHSLRRIGTGVILCALLAGPGLADDGVVVSARADASEIPLGQTLSLTVEVRGAGMSSVAPSTPSGLTNLKIVGGPSSSTSFSFMNGAVSSSKALTWYLAPQAVGKAHVPPIEVKVGDRIYRTEPIDVTVTPAGSGGARVPAARGPVQPNRLPGATGRDPGLADLRLDNEISATRVYVGQPVILTTRLLTRVQIVDVTPGPDPTLPGFLLEDTDTNVPPERVFREGREYQSFILMRRVLTPTTAGKTVVPPETRTIRVQAGRRDPFEAFFSPPVVDVARSTASLTIEALATPTAGRPVDFSGAVGSFRMSVTADRKEAAVGDAVGVKVSLTGTGNLKTVDHPILSPSADFRVFDPRIEEKASGTAPRIYAKVWSYVMTPLSPGNLTVPAIGFSYFDPEAKAYKRLSSDGERIAVERAAPGAPTDVAAAGASARREIQTLQRDIRFLKPLDSPLARRRPQEGSVWWAWAALGLALLVQPAAWFVSRNGGASMFVPGGAHGRARRRALAQIARARGQSADAVRAFGVASNAVVRYVADRCGIPAQGLTYEEIDAELASRAVGEDLRAELRSLLELCDLGRFAPEASRHGASAELLARARSLVERLDRQIGRAA